MTRFAYYARWVDCDCVVAVCVDEPGFEKDTAREVASFIRRRYRVERLSIDSVGSWRCEAHPPGSPYPWRATEEAPRG